MNLKRALIGCAALLLLVVTVWSQGDTKHFLKDGLSFDYANGWSIADESNSDAQVLTLTRGDSDAQIKLFVHRGKVDTPEKVAQAKAKLIDPYVEFMSKQFVDMGAKPERVAAKTEISGMSVEGVRIQVHDNDPGEAAIYWATLNNRLVVITFFGPDPALKKAMPMWDMVRNTIKIEPPSKASSTPKAKP